VPNRLLQLLADNRQAPARRFEVLAAKAGADDEAEIYLYDAIVSDELEAEYWGGVAPQSFVKALKDITAGTIHLRINSPGGSVFAARAIETALREHKARIVVHIDGVAASAATFIAMAGNEIIMAPGALFMIHKGWTFAMGNADDLRGTAELLDKVDGTLVDTYVARTGGDAKQISDWMAAETWFTAREAVDAGFADSVAESAPKAQASWKLDAYERAPKVQTSEPPAPAPAPAATTEHRDRQQQRLRLANRLQIA